MKLSEKLTSLTNESGKKMPDEIKELFAKATQDLKISKIEENALKVGDKAPSFKLKNAYGKEIDSAKLLENGPLVINFYRGKWCPYCNLELQEYIANLDKIENLGANFVAISPELPDETFSETMPFEVLSDLENKVANEFKLVFEVDKDVEKVYKSFGINLEQSNGDNNHKLPMPATYVIDANRKIVLAFVNVDYTKRLDIEDILNKLKEIN